MLPGDEYLEHRKLRGAMRKKKRNDPLRKERKDEEKQNLRKLN